MSVDVHAFLQRHKYTLLLVTLLLMILVPVIRGAPQEGTSELTAALVLLAAVHATAGRRSVVIVLGTIGVVSLVSRLWSAFGPQTPYQETVDNGGFAILAIFLAMTAFMVYSSIIRSTRISGDAVMGAIAVYLLIGIMWTNFYAIVYNLDESSFNFPAYARPEPDALIPEHTFGYYSFVTLTTLGYGDVTPTSFRSRTLSWLEAVVGVSYMATVIAFLVSQIMVEERRDRAGTKPRRQHHTKSPS
jgi:hypothetical protein